jgi:hypothetical protein
MKFRLWCYHRENHTVRMFQGSTLQHWDAIGPEWGPLVLRTYPRHRGDQILAGEHYYMTREHEIGVTPLFASLKAGVTADRDLFPRSMDAARAANEEPVGSDITGTLLEES